MGIREGVNGFAYAKGNPVRFSDKSGKYEEPVHGALTYQLAMAAGFTERDAAHLAIVTAGVDHDPRTAPVGGWFTTLSNAVSGVTARHHFPSFATALSNVRSNISEGRSMDLNRLGVALHALEDVGFHDAPGPHLRRSVEPTEVEVFSGLTVTFNLEPGGVSYSERVLPRISFTIPTLSSKLVGTPDSQHQHVGVGHPYYRTEAGGDSKMTNHLADQAFQDQEANTRQLLRVFELLKEAASSYYGENRQYSDDAARRAIATIVSADTRAEVNDFLQREMAFTGQDVHSYEWWVEHNQFTSVTWTARDIDSSVDPPLPQYIRSPDGSILNTTTGKIHIGPGAK